MTTQVEIFIEQCEESNRSVKCHEDGNYKTTDYMTESKVTLSEGCVIKVGKTVKKIRNRRREVCIKSSDITVTLPVKTESKQSSICSDLGSSVQSTVRYSKSMCKSNVTVRNNTFRTKKNERRRSRDKGTAWTQRRKKFVTNQTIC